jgi:5'-nucleotidase / UDP-sugar diphosphatase
MFNIFPFDNSITKMQVSGVEVQELFDFVARRSAGRGCVTQVQIAGARLVIDCTQQSAPDLPPGKAIAIYIGTYDPPKTCQSDSQCPGGGIGSCDVETERCWQPIDLNASYELATSDYLAGGGSGFRVLQRNTTQNNTRVQQRDALIDYIRAGLTCGADPKIERMECDSSSDCPANHACDKTRGRCDPRTACKKDGDCGAVGEGYVCACPEAVIEGAACLTDPETSCGAGLCVLAKCRDDVAAYQRSVCDAAVGAAREECITNVAPCVSGGEQCKFLACVDRNLGNFSDGRVRMVGQ